MYQAYYKNSFQKDLKRAQKRGKSMRKIKTVIQHLLKGETLAPRYRDHLLKGNYADCRECHIEPDWLLIYLIEEKRLTFIRTGSHADLFKK